MTFEELEADWELWKILPGGSLEFDSLLKRCPPIDNATFRDALVDSGVAVINGCIMLSYDDIVL